MSAVLLAHGGVEGDLGMPFSLFLYGLGAVVLVAYLVLRAQDRPVLPGAAGRGLGVPDALRTAVAVLGPVLGGLVWSVVLTAGLFGTASSATNIIWLALSVGLLALFSTLSVLLGDVWHGVSPFVGLGRLADRWVGGRAAPAWAGWVAPAGVLSLAWFLLSREQVDEPRGLGAWMLAYTAVVGAGALRWGSAWVHEAEGFGVLFRLFASLSPLRWVGGAGHDGDDGHGATTAVRWPLVGSTTVVPSTTAAVTLAVGLGLVLFDLFTTTSSWFDLARDADGAGFVVMSTLGLVLAVGVVLLVAQGVGRAVAAEPEDGSRLPGFLLPAFVAVVAGVTVAHDLPALLIDGQFLPILASDPYGQGWDLFGTAADGVDVEPLTAAAFGWLEYAAILLGGLGSLLVGHDLLVRRDDVRPLPRSLFVLALAVAAIGLAALAMVLGAGGD